MPSSWRSHATPRRLRCRRVFRWSSPRRLPVVPPPARAQRAGPMDVWSQRDRVGLVGELTLGAHATTTERAARNDKASETCRKETTSSPTRSAMVRATLVSLCRPRALRSPARNFAAKSACASSARSVRHGPVGRLFYGAAATRPPPRPSPLPVRRKATRRDPGGPEGTTRSKRSSRGADSRRRSVPASPHCNCKLPRTRPRRRGRGSSPPREGTRREMSLSRRSD